MGYERKINDEQVSKVKEKLETGMHVLESTKIVTNAQIKALMDILIDNKIATQKEIDDRTYDTIYQILSITNLI